MSPSDGLCDILIRPAPPGEFQESVGFCSDVQTGEASWKDSVHPGIVI